MRKKRTYMHKGKLRHKHRLPRKLKKQIKKYNTDACLKYLKYMNKTYGDDWMGLF